jgi:hypothetical protein
MHADLKMSYPLMKSIPHANDGEQSMKIKKIPTKHPRSNLGDA